MSELNRYAISEVYEILKHMSEDNKKMIPPKALKFLKENRDKEYKSSLDYTKPLKDQKINKNTKALLVMYYIVSFCKSREEQIEVLKKLKNNQKEGEKNNGKVV